MNSTPKVPNSNNRTGHFKLETGNFSVSEFVNVSVEHGVQTIRMARTEKKNALNAEMYEALATALTASHSDPDVHVRILTGSEGVFTAGNDIADFMAARERGEEVLAPTLAFLRSLVYAEKPIIAAVDGLAIGIGTTLLLHCDLAYATPEAVFVTPFLDLGLVPEAASSLLAPQRMGYSGAFALLVAGKPLTAEAALRAHLVNLIVPRENLDKHTLAVAAKLATKPPRALAMSRSLLRPNPDDVWARVEEEARLFKECLNSDEARKAFEAFMTKGSAEHAH